MRGAPYRVSLTDVKYYTFDMKLAKITHLHFFRVLPPALGEKVMTEPGSDIGLFGQAAPTQF